MSPEARVRKYETMIVLRVDLSEAGTSEQLDRTKKVVEQNGGAVSAIHEWGVRELAYPIEKQRRGYYALAEYTGTASTVAELERHLKLSDLVLRFISARRERDHPVAAPVRVEETAESAVAPDAQGESEAEIDDSEDTGGIDADTGDLE